MTPQFYARYIPPSHSTKSRPDIDDLEASRPPKKRMKQGDAELAKATAFENIKLGGAGTPSADKAYSNSVKTATKTSRSDPRHTELGAGQETSKEAESSQTLDHKETPDTTLEKNIPFLDRARRGDSNPIHDQGAAQVQSPADAGKRKKKAKRGNEIRTANESHSAEPAIESNTPGSAPNNRFSKHVKVLSKYERRSKQGHLLQTVSKTKPIRKFRIRHRQRLMVLSPCRNHLRCLMLLHRQPFPYFLHGSSNPSPSLYHIPSHLMHCR